MSHYGVLMEPGNGWMWMYGCAMLELGIKTCALKVYLLLTSFKTCPNSFIWQYTFLFLTKQNSPCWLGELLGHSMDLLHIPGLYYHTHVINDTNTVGTTKRNKDFRTLYEQANKMMYSFNQFESSFSDNKNALF